ncbi:hypothetical protein L209DRAFT_758715 [Thermothelomyces heterothallicus CBS 203.75]
MFWLPLLLSRGSRGALALLVRQRRGSHACRHATSQKHSRAALSLPKEPQAPSSKQACINQPLFRHVQKLPTYPSSSAAFTTQNDRTSCLVHSIRISYIGGINLGSQYLLAAL